MTSQLTQNKMNESQLKSLIEDFSAKQQSIEYNGYFSNHLSHGIVALYKLEASKERVQKFIDWYLPKLEKPVDQPEQVNLPDSKQDHDFDSLLGKRISYFPILNYYQKMLKERFNNSTDEFISTLFPRFAAGMGSSLLHVVIHTGYGCSVHSPTTIVEGIAYFHHSYAPIQLSKSLPFGLGTVDILDVVDDLRNDKALREYMITESSRPEWMSYYKGNAQKRVNILARDKGDELAVYASRIKLPDFFNVETATLKDTQQLMDWLLDCSIIVYQCSEKRNDFILLHGVTAAYSLKQIVQCFRPTQVKESLDCIKLFLIVLFSAYLTIDCPVINRSFLEESTSKSWDEIIKEALSLETDEHVYKLVQVCYERSLQSQPDKDSLYKSAALLSMSRPFF